MTHLELSLSFNMYSTLAIGRTLSCASYMLSALTEKLEFENLCQKSGLLNKQIIL